MSHGDAFEGSGRSEDDGRERRRKERVLHTRISEDLAEDLRRVAEDLRVPVSNLVRNVLEEAFSVVETVSDNVGELIEEVMDEAAAVRDRIRSRQSRRRRAEQRAGTSSAASTPSTPAAESAQPASAAQPGDVIGWQPLVLAKPQRCQACGALMGRGDSAYASVSPRGVGEAWRCEECPID